MSLITVIGRGHSGTRAMSHTLSASGVYMGEPLNESGDLIPPEDMYDACRILGPRVRHVDGLTWDFSQLHDGPIDAEFQRLTKSYLKTVLASDAEHTGWKIPETTLAWPWIARMFPHAKYIFWIRNPRDCILRPHVTDDLGDFDVPYPPTDDARRRRAISWKYQYDLVKATPRPKHWLEVRFEDFVLRQDQTLARLEAFLGFPLTRIEVKPEAVGRHTTADGDTYFDFLAPAMQACGYDVPAGPA